MYVCMYVSMYMYMYMHMYLHMYMYMHMYMYSICMYWPSAGYNYLLKYRCLTHCSALVASGLCGTPSELCFPGRIIRSTFPIRIAAVELQRDAVSDQTAGTKQSLQLQLRSKNKLIAYIMYITTRNQLISTWLNPIAPRHRATSLPRTRAPASRW